MARKSYGLAGDIPFSGREVEAVFQSFPETLVQKLLVLRRMIFEEAARLNGVGPINETLKWNQPAYLTSETGSGVTIRIDRFGRDDSRLALYVHCRSNLIETFRDLYPDTFRYEKTRAIVMDTDKPLPDRELRHCIGLALTWHQGKKTKNTISD